MKALHSGLLDLFHDVYLKANNNIILQASEDDIDVQDLDGGLQQSHESYTVFNITSNMEEAEGTPTQKHFAYDEDKSKRHCTEVDDEYDAIGKNILFRTVG